MVHSSEIKLQKLPRESFTLLIFCVQTIGVCRAGQSDMDERKKMTKMRCLHFFSIPTTYLKL